MNRLSIQDQAKLAIRLVKNMFNGTEYHQESLDSEMSRDELIEEVNRLRRELHALKRTKRGVKPKVQDAAKIILEHEDLVNLPVSMIAEILREVFNAYGVKCDCKDSSIRWYISQYNLTWDIKPRRAMKIEVISDDKQEQ